MIKLTLIILLVVVQACKKDKQYGKKLTIKETFAFPSTFQKNDFDYQFGAHLIAINNRQYLIYLTNNGKLRFVNSNFYTIDTFSIDATRISSLGYYSVRFHNAEMFVLDLSNRLIYKYKLNNVKLDQTSKYNLKNLFDWEKYSLTFQYNNCFEVDSMRVYLPYSIYDNKSNFIDDQSYIKLRLITDSTYEIESKVLFHPKELKNRKFRNTFPILTMQTRPIFVYGFECSDSIYLYNSNTSNIIKRAKFENHSYFQKYNPKKGTDISYVRRYDQTLERNARFLCDSSGNILIIRKLKKKEPSEKDSYIYYVLDSNLNVIAKNKFDFLVDELFCFSYKTGFLIFNSQRSQAFYYEVN